MTQTAPSPAAAGERGGRSRTRRLVGALAITQTIGYGVLYYSFSVLLGPIASDLHTSATAVTGALTVSVVVAAIAAIPIGRWLDRNGGRTLMTAGSVLGVVGVVVWSQATQVWQLYLAFSVIGLASAASLYEAAFAVVVATEAPNRPDRALLSITVVAGFASSIFLPLTGLLLAGLGWRSTLLVLAAVLATAIPAHAALVPGRLPPDHSGRSHVDGATVREALRDHRFWILGGAFVAQVAAVSSVGVLLVAYLSHAGHPATIAAALAGLLGVLSVAGRLVTTAVARRYGMIAITAVVFALQALGLLALPLFAASTVGAAACVVAFGFGFGVATIARPTIVTSRYGTARYATIAGAMAVPLTLAKAFAPPLAAALTPRWFVIAAGVCCLAGAVLIWTARDQNDRSRRRSPDAHAGDRSGAGY